MNVSFSSPDINIIKQTTQYRIKAQCFCKFSYEREALMRCGSIIDYSKETITLDFNEIPSTDDIVDKTLPNILHSNQKLKGIVYKHDNFDLDALKTLKNMGEYLEFLIIDDKIIGILTGEVDS